MPKDSPLIVPHWSPDDPGAALPEISRFFGILTAMYDADRQPPRFHARYGRARALVEIDPQVLHAVESERRPPGP